MHLGAFQLHTGGGLGDEFKKETGLDPSDPKNERATIDWALKNVNRTGWGPYHGARRVGVSPTMGLGGNPGYQAGVISGDGRANYFQRQGHGPFDRSEMQDVKTPFGNIAVNPQAAADFGGFYNELNEAGAPINTLGSYNKRKMRWSNQWSSHSMGTATDLDDQQYLSPQMKQWIGQNSDTWSTIKGKFNMTQPLPIKDPGHIEWTGPAARNREVVDAAQSPSKQAVDANMNATIFPSRTCQ